MPSAVRQSSFREAEFERLLADAFRKAAWKVTVQHRDHDQRFDLFVANRKHRYAVEFKAASEGRGDRLIPLLAQAILEAQAKACSLNRSVVPLAVVGAPRISESVAEEAMSFASQYAPDIAIGLIDLEGLRVFKGSGLELLNARRVFVARRLMPIQGSPAHLFSDLNQWMLKVLLAPRLPEKFLSAPRKEYRNASQLAGAAQVSVMSAFRFVRQLEVEGFLDSSRGSLELVRVPELMRRWQAVSLRPVRELSMRFIVRGDSDQLYQSLRSYVSESQSAVPSRSRQPGRPLPRVCLALFAAADALGTGFVHGIAPYIYFERPDNEAFRRLGLQISDNGAPADVYVRIPSAHEAIFRAAVERDGLPVCDILQVWLDVSSHPARGSAQAEEIRRRVLAPIFEAQE
jgi:hypothetical protein